MESSAAHFRLMFFGGWRNLGTGILSAMAIYRQSSQASFELVKDRHSFQDVRTVRVR